MLVSFSSGSYWKSSRRKGYVLVWFPIHSKSVSYFTPEACFETNLGPVTLSGDPMEVSEGVGT